jgi:hypothetical protein
VSVLGSVDTALTANDDNPTTPLSEVEEIIELPEFDASNAVGINAKLVELDEDVMSQLREYVTNIAASYIANRKSTCGVHNGHAVSNNNCQ